MRSYINQQTVLEQTKTLFKEIFVEYVKKITVFKLTIF